MDIKRTYEKDKTLTAKKVCQLLNNGKINDLPIEPQIKINNDMSFTGSERGDYISAVTLDNTHVLVTYRNIVDSTGRAVVLTIINGVISMGQVTQISSKIYMYSSCSMIDSTHVLVNFQYSDQYLWSVVLTISGATITVGTAVKVTNINSTWISSTKLDSSRVLVAYQDYSQNYLYAVVLTITGTTITIGTLQKINSSVSSDMSTVLLDTNKVLISYTNSSDSSSMYAVILTISGTTITIGTPVRVSINTTGINTCSTKLDSNHVFSSWFDTSNKKENIAILTISGTTITVGSPIIISNTTYISCMQSVLLDTTHIFLAFSTTSIYETYGVVITIINGVIENISDMIELKYFCDFMKIILIDSTHVGIAYCTSNSYSYMHMLVLNYNSTDGKVLGISQDINGTVLLKGISKGHSELIIGKKYYYDTNGNISTFDTDKFLGVAISDTELMIPNYIID